ncbi:MAG: energy transducer TonB [Vicinamibacterales bacterium]
MPRDLFGDVTRPSISVGNRKWYTVPVSLLSHSAIVLVLIALPILAPAVMPSVFADNDLTMITAIVPPTPPLPPRLKPVDMVVPSPSSGAPTVAPDGFSPEKPMPEVGWEDAYTRPGVITGDFDSTAIAPPPPVVAPPPAAVRPGGSVRVPQKVYEVNPVYPPIALSARIQGLVIIEATIGADGRVVNARVLRSVPMLDQAALDAVAQWEYTPTLLNGVPVPVIMTVTVSFTLSR